MQKFQIMFKAMQYSTSIKSSLFFLWIISLGTNMAMNHAWPFQMYLIKTNLYYAYLIASTQLWDAGTHPRPK